MFKTRREKIIKWEIIVLIAICVLDIVVLHYRVIEKNWPKPEKQPGVPMSSAAPAQAEAVEQQQQKLLQRLSIAANSSIYGS